MLEADKLECIRGDRRLFKAVSFRLDPGNLLYLQGKNGAGKTSLLRILIGLLPPESGVLRWQGQAIDDLPEDYRAQFCYLGHHNAIKEELTALENLICAAKLTQHRLTLAQALDALALVGLAGREDLPCKYLSQGQKRRVALARLVNEQRPLWILDEPFVALDTGAVAWLAELIAKHLDRGGMAVMTTHQPVPIGKHALQELSLS